MIVVVVEYYTIYIYIIVEPPDPRHPVALPVSFFKNDFEPSKRYPPDLLFCFFSAFVFQNCHYPTVDAPHKISRKKHAISRNFMRGIHCRIMTIQISCQGVLKNAYFPFAFGTSRFHR